MFYAAINRIVMETNIPPLKTETVIMDQNLSAATHRYECLTILC